MTGKPPINKFNQTAQALPSQLTPSSSKDIINMNGKIANDPFVVQDALKLQGKNNGKLNILNKIGFNLKLPRSRKGMNSNINNDKLEIAGDTEDDTEG